MKEDKKMPKFFITKVQKTVTWVFTKTGRCSISEKDSTGKTFDEIYDEEVIAEKVNILLVEDHKLANFDRRLMYCIREYEALTDNRSDFGHENQKTERMIKEGDNIFVAGKLTTLKDFFASDDFQKLEIAGFNNFCNFLGHEFNLKYSYIISILKNGLKDKVGDIKFVYIALGENGEHSLYWKFEEGDIYKPFDF